jgi:hypothetical protein
MQAKHAATLHWILFGFALAGAAWLVLVGLIRLDAAFDARSLTRQTLYESLMFLGGALACLWAAGWIVVSRPKPPPHSRFEGFTYY